MKRSKLACRHLLALLALLAGPAHAADDDSTATGAIHPADIVTTIAQAWGLALQVAIRRASSRDALQAAIDHETAETTRRFETIRCGKTDDGDDPVAQLAVRRIDAEIAALKQRIAVSYQLHCVSGTLHVTFDARAIAVPQ